MLKVLIVEDSNIISMTLRMQLEQLGVSVTESENCAAALKCFSQNKPDLAIVDAELPDGNGIDLVKNLKVITSGTIFVLHSGTEFKSDAVLDLFDEVLVKPANFETLEALVNRFGQAG